MIALRLRDLPRAASPATAAYRPTGTRTRLARRASTSRRALGVVPDPDRPRFFFLEHALGGGGRRALPEPGRARPSASSTSAPWAASSSPRTPCSTSLEPDAEALIVNRLAEPPQHAIAPIDECYRLVGLVKRAGRGSPAAAARPRRRGFFAELRERARRELTARARRRRGARARARGRSAPSRAPHVAAPDAALPLAVARARAGREVYMIALVDPGAHRPGLRALRRRRRASSSSISSARPSAGRRRRRASSGRASRRSCRRFTGRGEFTLAVPCTYDLEVAAAKYLDALPDGDVPLELPLHRPHLLPRRGRAAADRAGARGAARRATGCRSRRGGAMIDAALPGQRLHPAARRHAAARCGAAQGRARAADLRRGDRRARSGRART